MISYEIVNRKYTELSIHANICQYFPYCKCFALINQQYQSFSWMLPHCTYDTFISSFSTAPKWFSKQRFYSMFFLWKMHLRS